MRVPHFSRPLPEVGLSNVHPSQKSPRDPDSTIFECLKGLNRFCGKGDLYFITGSRKKFIRSEDAGPRRVMIPINLKAPLLATNARNGAPGNEIMALFDRPHSEGNTIVLVTHENDIAAYAHRVVNIKDGVVERDEVKR